MDCNVAIVNTGRPTQFKMAVSVGTDNRIAMYAFILVTQISTVKLQGNTRANIFQQRQR